MMIPVAITYRRLMSPVAVVVVISSYHHLSLLISSVVGNFGDLCLVQVTATYSIRQIKRLKTRIVFEFVFPLFMCTMIVMKLLILTVIVLY